MIEFYSGPMIPEEPETYSRYKVSAGVHVDCLAVMESLMAVGHRQSENSADSKSLIFNSPTVSKVKVLNTTKTY